MTKEMPVEIIGLGLEESTFKEVFKEKLHNVMTRYKAQLILLIMGSAQ